MLNNYSNAASPLADGLRDNRLFASGRSGMRGPPERLLDAIRVSDVTNPTFTSNNAGFDNKGIGKKLRTQPIENYELEGQSRRW
jgi:3-oxoacid CoA-transferase subunit A